MIKTFLAIPLALSMMTGIAFAQMSTSSTTTTTTDTPVVVVAPILPMVGVTSSTATQSKTSFDGTVTDKTQTYTTGTAVTPSGNLVTTKKSTESTTTR